MLERDKKQTYAITSTLLLTLVSHLSIAEVEETETTSKLRLAARERVVNTIIQINHVTILGKAEFLPNNSAA